jgi:hypothetical protein
MTIFSLVGEADEEIKPVADINRAVRQLDIGKRIIGDDGFRALPCGVARLAIDHRRVLYFDRNQFHGPLCSRLHRPKGNKCQMNRQEREYYFQGRKSFGHTVHPATKTANQPLMCIKWRLK